MNLNPNLKLDWVSYQTAKWAVEHWHYSRQLPKSKQNYIGVWENDQFIGIIVIGNSVASRLGKRYGLNEYQVAELTRIALKTGHLNPVSKIAMIAVRMVKKLNPGLRLLVSFADPKQGHNGAIYQAMNWIYTGETEANKRYLYKNKWRYDTKFSQMLKTRPELEKVLPIKILKPKYRYLYPLDKEMKKQIEPLRKPYPKSVQSIE